MECLKLFMPCKKVQKPITRENQKASQRSTWLCTCGVGPSTPPNGIKMQNDQRPKKQQKWG
jgi:hypothetical protein